MKYFIRQLRGQELGNFVNTTPIIQTLYSMYNEPIPVVFDTSYIAELYKNWNKIKIINLDEAKHLTQLIHTGEGTTLNKPEYISRHNEVMRRLNKTSQTIPHTYVPSKIDSSGDYCVIARGCIDAEHAVWKDKKEVGDEIYKYIIDRINIPIYIVGNTADYKRSLHRMQSDNVTFILDDINTCVSMIAGSKYFISNDTGFMHVASALNKESFVIWKHTPFEKNKTPSSKTTYSKIVNWYTDFDRWIDARQK